MATKKTTEKTSAKAKPGAKKAAPKKAAAAPKAKAAPKAPKEKTEAKPALPRHPKARVAQVHGSKDQLAKSLAASIAREDEDQGVIADRLRTASNTQLLRLQSVVATVQKKYGSRAKLIEAIGTAEHKSKDKDYLAKLDSFSLPQLLDLAASHERRARA
jgi:hypothetical protein